MPWRIDEITDPEQRLAWLRRQGKVDADLVIASGAAGAKAAYKGWMNAPRDERDAYFAAYDDEMHQQALEREAAGVQVVSPDYRGPLTETDWWRGITVTSPDGTVTWSPEKARELERRKRGDESGHA